MVGVKWDKENNTIVWQRKEGLSNEISKPKQKLSIADNPYPYLYKTAKVFLSTIYEV